MSQISNDQLICQKSSDCDLQYQVIDHEQKIIAQCSLWWENTPLYQGAKVGFLGNYQGTKETANLLLENAENTLKKSGCNWIIAPVDGIIWQRYRLITEDQGYYPQFFLEPNYPQKYLDHFLDQNFIPIAHYYSSLCQDLQIKNSFLNKYKEQLLQKNLKIRAFDLAKFNQEMEKIYDIVCQSFRNYFLYQPLPQEKFINLYQNLLPYINPELIRIVEDQDQPVAFLFAIPDWLQQQRGEIVKTLIIKTIAVLPAKKYAGLGTILVDECHQIAHKLGYNQIIHALMHENNSSRRISQRYQSRIIRRYSLLGKKLEVPEFEKNYL
jgi:GNAT superfamily N-acetyltransferase